MELLDPILKRIYVIQKEITLKGELAGITITIRAIDADEWQETRKLGQLKLMQKVNQQLIIWHYPSSLMAIGCVNPNRDPAVLGGITVQRNLLKQI